MRKTKAVFFVWVVLLTQLFAEPGLTLIYVRHAETWGNIKGALKRAGRADEIPSGGNLFDRLSPHGEEQLKDWFTKLDGVEVDAVLVSPAQRTQRTALAFLEARNMTAEIWPELIECHAPSSWLQKPDTSVIDPATLWARGWAVQRVDETRFLPRPGDDYADCILFPKTPVEAAYLTEETIRLLEEHYGNSGKTILLVGHSMSGRRLITYLLKTNSIKSLYQTKLESLRNCSVSILRQGEEGLWELICYSDEEIGDAQRKRAGEKSRVQ